MSIWKAKAVARSLVLAVAAVLLVLGSSAVTAQEDEYALGDIPLDPVTYQKYLKARPEGELLATLPTTYDARDQGLVTPPKSQGACGSCWAFASVGAMESHMLKQFGFGPTNLSEQQQVSCNTLMWGCDGGSSAALLYWGTKGPLYESCFPYTASDATPCTENLCTQLDFHVVDWHTVPATPEDFKYSLYTYGPSYWRYNVHSDFGSFWAWGDPGDVYVNSVSAYEGGHAVLLIGWSDYKQAYLCKNSWGTGGPNNDGTFWIAYSGHANNLNFGMANFSLDAPGSLPQPPTNLTATAVPLWQINLSWTDNSSNETGFRIERRIGSSSWSTLDTVGANTTSYPDTGLTPETTYSYRVIAYNTYGDSDPSNTASDTTPPIIIGPLAHDDHIIDDDDAGGTSGDGNGYVNCGETVGLIVTLRNEGNTAVEGIDTTLSFADDTYISSPVGNMTSAYPDIGAGASADNLQAFGFSVDSDAKHGHWIQLELAITADNWGPGSVEFELPIFCSTTADYRDFLPLIFR